GVQYYRRKTVPARWMTLALSFLVVFTQFVPWQQAFAIQQRLSPNRAAGQSVNVTFDPGFGKFHSPPGANRRDDPTELWFPLAISGLSNDSALKVDRAQMRWTGADGRPEPLGNGGDLEGASY